MQYVSFEPGIEVSGAGMIAAHDGFKTFTFLASQILLAEGIGTPRDDGTAELDPRGWYSFDAYMRAYKRIAEQIGDSVLENVGEAMVSRAQFPPQINDVPGALSTLDIAYHMNHRKGGQVMFDPSTGQLQEGIGHYNSAPVPGKKAFLVTGENPYPCRFDLGLIRSIVKRFDPSATVVHDNTKPCRQKGKRSCTYYVTYT